MTLFEGACMRLFLVIALAVAAVSMTFAQSSKQIITTGGNATLPFSPAVKADGLIYVAGMIGPAAPGVIAKGDIKAQTKQTLDNIAATLKAGGSSMANAASVLVYLRNVSDFAAMNEVYSTFWPKDPPARTTVIVTQPWSSTRATGSDRRAPTATASRAGTRCSCRAWSAATARTTRR
jgi:enamine deaminase RidA (YjgF/YER057c/UK114 family)